MKKKESSDARRDFLTTLSKLSAVMATLGITQAVLTKQVMGQTSNIEPIQIGALFRKPSKPAIWKRRSRNIARVPN